MNILQLLESNKIKERNEGLGIIEDALPLLFSNDVKVVHAVCTSLVHLIDSEKYQKNSTASSRMNRACSLLRSTIENTIRHLPPRASKLINLMVSMTQIANEEIFVDIVKSIKLILTQQYVKDHCNLHTWKSMFDFFLENIYDGTITIIAELLDGLYVLMASTLVVPLAIYSQLNWKEAIEIINDRVLQFNTDPLILLSGLKIVNWLLIVVSCEQFGQLDSLIDLGFGILHLTVFNFKNNYDLNDEISVFLNQDIVHGCVNQRTGDGRLKQLIKEYIILHLEELDAIGKPIFLQAVGLIQTRESHDWFHLNTLYLKDADPQMWMFLMGLSKLIKFYYLLDDSDEWSSNEILLVDDESNTSFSRRKKRKIKSVSSVLSSSRDEYEFFTSMLSRSSSTKLKIIILQLLLFSIESGCRCDKLIPPAEPTMWDQTVFKGDFEYTDTSRNIINILISNFNDKAISTWVLFVINSLLYRITRSDQSLDSQQMLHLLVFALPIVKVEQYSEITCHMVYNLVEMIVHKKIEPKSLSDDVLLSQLKLTCEQSNQLGPAFMSNSSLKFWVSFCKLMELLGFRSSSNSSMIYSWMSSKWDQKFDPNSDEYCLDFQQFIGFENWIVFQRFGFVDCPNTGGYHGRLRELYTIAKRHEKIRQFSFPLESPFIDVKVDLWTKLTDGGSFQSILTRFTDLANPLDELNLEQAVKLGRHRTLYLSSMSMIDEGMATKYQFDNVDFNVFLQVVESKNRNYYKVFTGFKFSLFQAYMLENPQNYTRCIECVMHMIKDNSEVLVGQKEDFLTWLTSLKMDDMVMVLYELTQINSLQDLEFCIEMLKCLGKYCLNNVLYERNQITFVILCESIKRLAAGDDVENPIVLDIIQWVSIVSEKQLILSDESITQYMEMLLTVMKYMRARGMEQTLDKRLKLVDLEGSFMLCFRIVPQTIRIRLLSSINGYLDSYTSSKLQLHLYEAMIRCFSTSNQDDAVGYCQFLALVHTSNHMILSSVMFNLLEMATYIEHFVKQALDLVKCAWPGISVTEIFGSCAIPILRAWLTHYGHFQTFPYSLFPKSYVLNELIGTILSVILSTKLEDYDTAIGSFMTENPKINPNFIVPQSFILAFTPGGTRNGIYSRFQITFKLDLKYRIEEDGDLVILEAVRHLQVSDMGNFQFETLKGMTKLTDLPNCLSPESFTAIITSLLKKLDKSETCWNTLVLYFIIRKLLVDVSLSITQSEIQANIRRILVAICYYKTTKSANGLHLKTLHNHIVEGVFKNWTSQEIGGDVIVLFKLLDFDEGVDSQDGKRLLVNVLASLIPNWGQPHSSENQRRCRVMLNHLLSFEHRFVNIAFCLKQVLCEDLKPRVIDLDSLFEQDMGEPALKVCAFLFHYWPSWEPKSDIFFKSVMRYPLEKYGKKFELFAAKVLTDEHLQSGYLKQSLLDDFYEFDDAEGIDYEKRIIESLLKFLDTPDNPAMAQATDIVTTLIGKDTFHVIHSINSNVLTYISPSHRDSLQSYIEHHDHRWEENIKKYGADFVSRSVTLFGTLVQLLPSETKQTFQVIFKYAKCNSSFALDVLPDLICYAVKSAGDIVENQIVSFLDFSQSHSHDSNRLLLLIWLKIRQETKRSNSAFEALHSALNHKISSAITGAADSEFYRAGLMLLEDAYFVDKASSGIFSLPSVDTEGNEEWFKKPDTLKIFKSIDCEDLQKGLPQQSSFTDVLNGLRNGPELDSNERMMLELANYESDWLFENDNRGHGGLVNTMLANGLSHASKAVGENLGNMNITTEYDYEWAWKLSEWSLPPVEKPTTSHESIYKALKAIKDRDHSIKDLDQNKDTLEGICTTIVNWKEEINKEKSITALSKGLDDFYQSLTILNIMLKNLKETPCTKRFSFDKLDEINLSKMYSIQLELSRSDHNERTKALILELANQNDLAIKHFKGQKVINTITAIDNLISKSTDLRYKLLANYHIAKGLWFHNHQNLAVKTMYDIRSSLVDSSGSLSTLLPGSNVHDSDIHSVSRLMVDSILVEWLSKSKQELPSTILDKFLNETPEKLKASSSSRLISASFKKFARFCEDQYRSGEINGQLKQMEIQLQAKRKELDSIKEHYSKVSVPTQEKRAVQKYYTKLKLQFSSESKDQAELRQQRIMFLEKAIECYLESIFAEANLETLDRFFPLWFEQSSLEQVNLLVKEKFRKELPNHTHQFVGWSSQLVSRLSDEPGSDSFQNLVGWLVKLICIKFPYNSLYHLLSLKYHANHAEPENHIMQSKIRAANKIYSSLMKEAGDNYVVTVLQPCQDFCNEAMDLAKVKVTKGRKVDFTKNTKLNGRFWLNNLPSIPAPTQNLSANYTILDLPVMELVNPIFTVASSGLSLPKILEVRISNGKTLKMLFKHGTDDLRQDAIMEQVFEKVNQIFKQDNESLKRNLQIRTYKIVPIGPSGGILEFVPDSKALVDIVKPYHDKYDSLDIQKARDMMKEVQNSDRQERIRLFKQKVLTQTSPMLHRFFVDKFLVPKKWFNSRLTYSYGLAITSMVGHVLGLGDRHCNNILLDENSGEPIHIDLGVSFDQGTKLPIPETVPFRLTRDLVAGLGITGVEGIYRTTCEITFKILRTNQDNVISILNVLRWDPLFSWKLSPIQKKNLQFGNDTTKDMADEQENITEAAQAILTVKNKLQANGLSHQAVVRELIRTATNEENLALLFCGWTPFY